MLKIDLIFSHEFSRIIEASLAEHSSRSGNSFKILLASVNSSRSSVSNSIKAKSQGGIRSWNGELGKGLGIEAGGDFS